jgi:KTSC domain-containing protein
MLPKMRPVDSSSIAAIGYDERARKVYVRFRTSRRLYAYTGVPARVFRDLERAESKGRFVNEVIKPGYAVRKL